MDGLHAHEPVGDVPHSAKVVKTPGDIRGVCDCVVVRVGEADGVADCASTAPSRRPASQSATSATRLMRDEAG